MSTANDPCDLVARAFAALRPPPDLTLSEWADDSFVLSPESSTEPGAWTTIPYQRGIMDTISDETVPKITVMKSARVGYTKMICAAIGYHADQDPCSTLVLQPTDEDAKGFSAEEIQPMFRDVPALSGKLQGVQKADGRAGRQTMLKLQMPGGTLTIAGAKSPRNFRRITVRKVFRDEVDAYETSKEGDPIALSAKRTQTAYAPQEVNGSTPTIKGLSLIEREYEKSDKRRFRVPCPHCGEEQVLKWPQVRWPEGRPEEAHYVCEANGCIIEEHDKSEMIANGRWVAEEPYRGHAGFHISALYSPFPGARWGVLATEFLEAKRGGPSTLQVFVNTVLGETWDEAGETLDASALAETSRTSGYTSGEMPVGPVLVTAGVDIQDDRFEVEFVGWGSDESSWSLDYVRWFGDPTVGAFWDALDEQLGRVFVNLHNQEFRVEAACVDTGGHHTDAVYKYTRARFAHRIYGIKGATTWDAPIWPSAKAKKVRGNAILFNVGVNAAKVLIQRRLKIEDEGPGFCRFPNDYPASYFEQLTAEKLITRYVKGFPVRSWQKPNGARNEALDCRVYATAARHALRLDLRARANALAPAARPAVRTAPVPPTGSGRSGDRRGDLHRSVLSHNLRL